MKNKRLIILPQLRFRNEGKRCVLYTVDDFFYNPEHITIVYPYEVFFLLLFDGKKTFSEVCKDFDYLFNTVERFKRTPEETGKLVIKGLESRIKLPKLLIEAKNLDNKTIDKINSRYSIKDFIIPDKKLDMNFTDIRLKSPLSVNFNASTVCGFRCKYCYHPLNPVTNYLGVDRLKEIFKELDELKCESILLSGGDPLCNPYIEEIVEELGKTNIKFTISTKSVLSEKQLKHFFDCGLRTLQVSLDSVDNTIVQNLLGISDKTYVEKIIDMIHFCIKIGIRVRVKSVLTSYNIESIPALIDKFNNIPVEEVRLVQYGRTAFRHTDDLFPSAAQLNSASKMINDAISRNKNVNVVLDELVQEIRNPISMRKDKDEVHIFKERAICNAGRNAITLLPNGEVTVCENLPYQKEFILGNLAETSVKEFWNGSGVKKWLSPPDRDVFAENSPCRKCKKTSYNTCHKLYSRCLRFCYETFKHTNEGDIHCPLVHFEPYRLT